MNHLQEKNCNQIRIVSFEEIVEPKSLVRIIDAFVGILNLKEFEFSYFQTQ